MTLSENLVVMILQPQSMASLVITIFLVRCPTTVRMSKVPTFKAWVVVVEP